MNSRGTFDERGGEPMLSEALLRRVLEDEAAGVEVRPDALPEIRRRIAARRARWWLPARLPGGSMFALGTGAAVATVAALVVGLGSCVPEPTHPPIGGATATPTAPPPTSASTAGPTPGASSGVPVVTANLRVFYLRGDRGQPRLYPEFHQLAAGDGSPAARTRAALTEMFDGRTAYDPDYSSGWPAGTRVRDVRIEPSAVVVDLTGFTNGDGSGQIDPETVRQSVQQLIWTATAGGTSGRDTVRLLLDGRPVANLFGAVDVSGDLRRAPAASVLGLIWVIDPQHGATVGRSFRVHLAGIVFEATMRLRVRQGSTVVSDQLVTLSNGGPSQGEAFVNLTLAPGTYTLEGYANSSEDGHEEYLEDHVITVR